MIKLCGNVRHSLRTIWFDFEPYLNKGQGQGQKKVNSKSYEPILIKVGGQYIYSLRTKWLYFKADLTKGQGQEQGQICNLWTDFDQTLWKC